MFNKSLHHKFATFLEQDTVRSYRFSVCNAQKMVALGFKETLLQTNRTFWIGISYKIVWLNNNIKVEWMSLTIKSKRDVCYKNQSMKNS